MVSHEELRKIANTRLKDAEVLLSDKRYDGALYLSGYAIELGLKALIAKNLNPLGPASFSHIPSTKEEFKLVASITDHDLDRLLGLLPSSVQRGIKTKYLAEWSLVQKWNPEMRYAPIRGASAKNDAGRVILAVRKILLFLGRQD